MSDINSAWRIHTRNVDEKILHNVGPTSQNMSNSIRLTTDYGYLEPLDGAVAESKAWPAARE